MARPKGSKNKVSISAKDNVMAVFTRLGGTHAMAEWARKNNTEFYRLYARLIPQELSGKVAVEHKVETGDAASLQERLDNAFRSRSQLTVQ